MKARELVMRTRSKEDRRVVEIDLTEQGRELLTQSPEVAQGLLVKGLETLPKEKLFQLDEGLKSLVKILGAQEIPPKLLLSPEVNLPKGNKMKAAAKIDAPAKSRKKTSK